MAQNCAVELALVGVFLLSLTSFSGSSSGLLSCFDLHLCPDCFLKLGPKNINQGGFLSVSMSNGGVRTINYAIIVFFPLSFCSLVLFSVKGLV